MISAFNQFAKPRSHSRRPYDQAVLDLLSKAGPDGMLAREVASALGKDHNAIKGWFKRKAAKHGLIAVGPNHYALPGAVKQETAPHTGASHNRLDPQGLVPIFTQLAQVRPGRHSTRIAEIHNLLIAAGPEGMSFDDLAERLQIQPTSVRMWFSRNAPEGFRKIGPGRFAIKEGATLPTAATMPKQRAQPARRPQQEKGRVFWDAEEKEKLIAGFVQDWQANPGRELSVMNFQKTMRRVLLANRWRKLNTVPDELRLAIIARQKEVLAPKPPQQVTVEVQAPVEQVLVQAPLRALLAEIGGRLDDQATQLQEIQATLRLIGSALPAQTASPAPTGSPARTVSASQADATAPAISPNASLDRNTASPARTTRVWIIGLSSGQQKELSEKLRNHPVKLLNWADSFKNPDPGLVPRSADWYVKNCKQIPHKWAYLIEQEVPREKIVNLFGYRAIEEWLRNLAATTLLQSSGLAS